MSMEIEFFFRSARCSRLEKNRKIMEVGLLLSGGNLTKFRIKTYVDGN